MAEISQHAFHAESIHVVCITPFSYGSFAGEAAAIREPRGIFLAPSTASKNLIAFRRQTFSAELDWSEKAEFFSIDLPIISIGGGQRFYTCIYSNYLLTVYPNLICTLQMHVELREPVSGVESVVEMVRFLRDASPSSNEGINWIRCQYNSGVVEFSTFHSLVEFIRGKLETEYYLSSRLPVSASFVFPIFYCGLVKGCKDADELIARYRADIAGMLNLWSNNYDLQSKSEIEARTRRNFHPLVYGASYVSSAGFFEFHPENVTEIAKRDGTSVREHHFREIYYAATICEIAAAKYFALRICDAILDSRFSSTKISPMYIFNPFLSLYRALDVLKFERSITVILGSIRSLGLTRKPYTREILEVLDEQFDTTALQDRVAQKVIGINRILTSMFQSVIATTTLAVAAAAAILTAIQIWGITGPPPNASPSQVHDVNSPK